MKYDKLVRDRIPEIIKKQGGEFAARQATEEEYFFYLKKKLIEEVKEFLEEPSIKEMADIQEVMNAILKDMGYYQADLREARREKNEDRGMFEERWILEEVKGQ